MIKKWFYLCDSREWGSAQKGVKFGYVCVYDTYKCNGRCVHPACPLCKQTK